MWTVQRLIQAGVNRFVLDLPPTPAVARRGHRVPDARVGDDHRAGRGRARLGLRRSPCRRHPVRGALHDRRRGARPGLGRVQARAARGARRDPPPLLAGRRCSRSRSPCPRRRWRADEPKTDPTKEFLLEPWIEIPKIGPIDLSITKGVFYLFLSTAILLIGTLLVVRHLRLHPKRLQAFVEIVYDFSETQIGRASLPAKTYTTWFPYLATLFLFIWINNMISYLPLPVDTEHKIWGVIPTPSFYAATSNLSVTLALTLVTFFASHYVGIKHNGTGAYFKSWFPPVCGPDQDPDRAARDPLAVPAARLAQRPAVREHAGRATCSC